MYTINIKSKEEAELLTIAVLKAPISVEKGLPLLNSVQEQFNAQFKKEVEEQEKSKKGK